MVSKFAPLHIEICKTLRIQLQYIFVWNDELEKFSSTFYLTLIHNFRHHFGVSIIFKFLKSSSTSSTALDCFPGFLYSSKCDSRFLDVCMRTTTVCVRACVVFFFEKKCAAAGTTATPAEFDRVFGWKKIFARGPKKKRLSKYSVGNGLRGEKAYKRDSRGAVDSPLLIARAGLLFHTKVFLRETKSAPLLTGRRVRTG